MPGLPIDVPVLWLGTAIVTASLIGISLQLPTVTPARAGSVAETIDGIAAAPYPSSATHPLTVDAIRLRPHRIALRTPNGVSHATLGFGPVTPVTAGSKLDQVLRGTRASAIFESPRKLQEYAESARNRTAHWLEPTDSLIVRRVSWGGVDVVLVGV